MNSPFDSSQPFSRLPLPPAMLANLDQLGYREMTPIQSASLPAVLDRRDLIAQAKTGSGKTAAYGIGMLQQLNISWFAIQGLVLCPTRELADQVAQELRRLARFAANIKVLTLCGGTPMRPQIASLEHGAHIVVGTPGRVGDHIRRGTLKLRTLQTLVLDEADRMTDMGFAQEMAGIVAACPPHRQTLLFSATYPDDIRQATAGFLRDPVEVRLESRHDEAAIEQRFYEIAPEQRYPAVVQLLLHFRPLSSLVFCNTGERCRELAAFLNDQGISALALYGELEQRERDEILVLFSNLSCSVLVATDLAARGLDLEHLEAVINADVARDPDVHLHRIGRGGRGRRRGLALSLAAPAERRRVDRIAQAGGNPPAWHALPLPDNSGMEMPLVAPMRTLCIAGGKRHKLRPGDIMGALAGEAGLSREQVGKIHVFEFSSYVALERGIAQQACERLLAGAIKGQPFRLRFVDAPSNQP